MPLTETHFGIAVDWIVARLSLIATRNELDLNRKLEKGMDSAGYGTNAAIRRKINYQSSDK
jgi:hypothetical protein